VIFEPFSQKDLEKIHAATLEILEQAGVIIEGKRAREILLSAGCTEKDGRIYFPSGLVEDALKDPVPLTFYGIDESIVLPLTEAERSYSHNFGSVSVLLDHETDQIREAKVKDMEDFARLSDSLPYLDLVVPSLRATDIPEEIANIGMAVYTMKNTRKPVDIGTASDSWETRYLIEVAATIRGGLDKLKNKPMGTISISPLSPLNFPADIAEAIVDCAGLGLPLTMLPCPTRGLTAPMTLVGGLVQQNAEQLAFLTLAKLVNRSCPLVYTCRLASANMRTGFVGGKDPDLGLSGACVAQVARYYGLPSGVYGMDTGASVPDIQSGYERAINCLPPVLARATMVSGFGLLNGGLLASAEEMVIDNEIYGMLMHRLGRDLEVDDEIIGLEVIKAVMDGGNFLAQEHTRDFMRKGELWQGKLGNALPFEEWRSRGCPDIRAEAKEKVNQLLDAHPGPYLDEKLCRELDLILEKARDERVAR
jgi:trimethylamine--corrinoid protein Co-methyltransferase